MVASKTGWALKKISSGKIFFNAGLQFMGGPDI